MNGPEHYREAERLLHYQYTNGVGSTVEPDSEVISLAQVHATLALAAATAMFGFPGGPTVRDTAAWENAASAKHTPPPADRIAGPEARHAAPTPAPRREGSGETVCGSEFVGIHGDTTTCTYPPGHGPIVGSNGWPWDHGIKGTPAVWRKAAPGGPIPTHLVAGDWTRDDSDDEDDPR